MSDVSDVRKAVAVICSDVHLSDSPPTARAEQGFQEWRQAMKEVLRELNTTCYKLPREKGVESLPLIIAGDLFDKPKPSPGLITFAADYLPPTTYAIAGQHDLPNHSMGELEESGLGLLTAFNRVRFFDHFSPITLRAGSAHPIVIHGYSWKEPVYAVNKLPGVRDVAVIHRYCWSKGHSFPGCPEEDHVEAQAADLVQKGFDAAVWGDNHSGFVHQGKWVNNGIVIPRNSDYAEYVPHYTVLYNDCTLERVPMNTKPKWQKWVVDGSSSEKASAKIIRFAEEIASLVGKDTKEDFLSQLRSVLTAVKDDDVKAKVSEIIGRAETIIQ